MKMSEDSDLKVSCKIVCDKCELIILKPNVAERKTLAGLHLPDHTGQPELVENFATVTDIYAFENVGFLKPVDGKKVTC